MNYNYLFIFAILAYANLHAMAPLPKKLTTEQDGVRIYNTSHREKVLKIGLENITRLASTNVFTAEEYQRLVREQIAPSLETDTVKVYVKHGQPVGFITYQITQPWYKKYVSLPYGPNAHINHLAIEDAQRKNGYGSALLKAALEDCKSQSVNRVTLWTTGNGIQLESCYQRFGFNMIRETKVFFSRQYALRLNRHPAILMGTAALSWAKTKIGS